MNVKNSYHSKQGKKGRNRKTKRKSVGGNRKAKNPNWKKRSKLAFCTKEQGRLCAPADERDRKGLVAGTRGGAAGLR